MTTTDARSILMIAYHYPPIQTSSGVHRTVSFSRGLQQAGWDTAVMTVSRNALESIRTENEQMIPEGVRVIRAPTINSVNTLSFRGKYFARTANPDRWVSWVVSGVLRGLAEIALHRPRVLFSTYPIASAHLVAYYLWKFTRVPWIADFRDPMLQDEFPPDPAIRRSFLAIERRVMLNATRLVFTAPGAIRYYRDRYPEEIANKASLIENGFEEQMFAGLRASPTDGLANAPLTLLHSGIVYPSERDPTQLFAAVTELKRQGRLGADALRIIFRGSFQEERFAPQVQRLGIDDIIEFRPAVPYEQALREMTDADALLVMQAENCNFQIPAKTYEYLRIGRPIVGLAHPEGDTAELLRRAGVSAMAPLDDADAIAAVLVDLLASHRAGTLETGIPASFIDSCSRSARTETFVALAEAVARG